MPTWKRFLLNLYYHGTLPYRAHLNAAAVAAAKAPVMVLFYHRIADDDGSPWTLTNREFAAQIRWLKSNFDMISLGEAQRRIAERRNIRPAVSITFDDGYASNCDEAVPLMIAEKVPCTYFVTSRCVLEQQPFPHDVTEACGAWPNTLEQIRSMAAAGIEIGAAHPFARRSWPDPPTAENLRRGRGRRSGIAAGARPADPIFRISIRSAAKLESRSVPARARVWL